MKFNIISLCLSAALATSCGGVAKNVSPTMPTTPTASGESAPTSSPTDEPTSAPVVSAPANPDSPSVVPAPQAPAYREIEREKMLGYLKTGSPFYNLRIDNGHHASYPQKKFLDFFQSKIVPVFRTIRDLNFKSTWYNLTLDRALYNDDAEQNAWESEKVKAAQELNTLENGDEWKATVATWATLAEKLKGPLADEARAMKKRQDIEAFASSEIPKLNRLSELITKIDSAANESVFASHLSATATTIAEAKSDFEAGNISLAEAAKIVSEARAQGEQGHSRDIAETARQELNESAVLNTELAVSKGFKTWSEYQVAIQAEPYDKQFKSVKGRIRFLRDLLDTTDKPLQLLLRKLATRAASAETLTESHLALLLPDTDSFGKYFPREKMDTLWFQSLLDSGFPTEEISRITRDVMPRANKYTHAYQTALSNKVPKELVVDAKSLALNLPSTEDAGAWHQAQVFILQNFFSDSVDSIRTAFHEGGHAIHNTFEVNPFETPEAYGYVEIHSMTQEYFLLDPQFLRGEAVARDGSRPSEQEIQSYVRNMTVQDFVQFRILVARALYELELWNFSFTAQSESFVNRSVRLYGEIIPRATGVKGAENHGVDFTGRGPFNAPHFRSGSVQYIGYVVANIAAFQSYQSLLDQVEQETGRRSVYKQSALANRLINDYYLAGYKLPFPRSVEAFTGKPYSADKMAKDFAKAIGAL